MINGEKFTNDGSERLERSYCKQFKALESHEKFQSDPCIHIQNRDTPSKGH
jgi:hypothetical protein